MRQRWVWAALAAAAWTGQACGVSLALRHSDGEFVDRGAVTAEIGSTSAVRLDCAAGATVVRTGNSIELAVRAAPEGQGAGPCTAVVADLGRLAVGTYQVRALLAVAGALETATQRITVLALEGRCNAEPTLQPALIVAPAVPASAFAQRVATDPAYAASLGHPVVRTSVGADDSLAYLTYPPLDDPTVASVRLHEMGEFKAVYRNAYLCLSPPPPDRVDTFLEFVHAGLDEYFYTADAGEILAIERGDVGAWTRTGEKFTAVTFRGCPASSADTVVYRFAGKPGVGSHFFTRDRAECATVQRSGQWEFEGLPLFAAPLAADGTCDAAHTPLYRIWRPFGASNHRFTTDPATVSAMVARGWVAEGAAMCVRKST